LLLNQNDWTVPYLYLGAFCKYVYNQQFWNYVEISILAQ
jgi:hypothetical protein